MYNSVFSSFLFFLTVVCIAFVPWPIFFDLGNFFFVMQKTPFPTVNKAVPLGLFFFILGFFFLFCNSLLKPRSYSRLVSSQVTILLFFLFVLALAWVKFISQGSFVRAVQVTIPILLLGFLAYPTSFKKQKILIYVAVFSSLIFFILHLISIFAKGIPISEITEYESGLFFSYGVYQAFVSYSGVIGLYAFLYLVIFLIAKKRIKKIFFLACYSFTMLLAFIIARKASLLELFLYFSLGSLIFFKYLLVNNFRVTRNVAQTILLLILPVAFFCKLLPNTPIFSRISRSVQQDKFDEGRLDIYNKALKELFGDPINLLVGHGGKSGYHNYILDMVYTMGLFPFVLAVWLMMIYVIIKPRVSTEIFNNNNSLMLFAVMGYLGLFLVQTMVNASISQPYYLINFLMCALFITFILKEVKKNG
ncbi:MAG: hypothetical protein CSA42_01505 [Gammaproteobacteria bacterium]|nr:MAG: hypothetical protein CSA42_01505 [Gammaproteobacteria bacterium]